jgi:serine/threonine protein kinase
VHTCWYKLNKSLTYAVKIIDLESNIQRTINQRFATSQIELSDVAKVTLQAKKREQTKLCRSLSCLQDLINEKNVVGLIDVFISDNRSFYIVQPFADGGNLYDQLENGSWKFLQQFTKNGLFIVI